MASTKSCVCGNNTSDNRANQTTSTLQQQPKDPSHVIIVVSVTVSCIAVLTIVVVIWLTVRRRRMKRASDRKSEISDGFPNRTVPRIEMYSCSLDDLRHIGCERQKLHLTRESLNSSSNSRVFLHHGDHNNTILNTLSATWSLQTLPNPPLPGDLVINEASTNPLYRRPFVIQPRRCVSYNALYESVDKLFPGRSSRNCSRTRCSRSPAYQSIDELKHKPAITRHQPQKESHYKRIDLFQREEWKPNTKAYTLH